MIDPKAYTSGSKGKSRPLMFNIRLSKRGAKPTKADVVSTLEYMLANQRVPAGWKVAVINWRDPGAASDAWRTGSLRDTFAADGLGRVIEAALEHARIAVVRRSSAAPLPDRDEDDDEEFDDE